MTHSSSNVSASDLRKGTAISTLSALCYATGVLLIRYAYRAGLTAGTALFLRFMIASAALGLFLALRRQWTRLPRSHTAALFLVGFLAYSFMGIAWFIALRLAPAWLISLFFALLPLPVCIGSWLFLGEPMDRQRALALTIVLIGGIALFWQGFEGGTWTGVLVMVAFTVVNTLYVLLGQRWTKDIHPALGTVWITIGAMMGTALYAVFSGQLSFDFAPVGWLWVTLLGIVTSALSIGFFWWGASLIGASRASIISALEPPFSILMAVFILGESMTPRYCQMLWIEV